MGTYWAFVGVTGALGVYYFLSAFISLPEWLAPRRFPGVFMLVTGIFSERGAMVARRLLMAAIFFFCAGSMALRALHAH